MKVFGVVVLVGCLLFGGCAILTVTGIVGNYFGEAVQVAQEEFGPRELLRKYEWFKDVAAQLDKKVADIKVYQARLGEYDGVDRKDLDRIDKQLKAQIAVELAGVKASYNGLAAEYNAAMSKFNYRFTNAGMLPEGASQTLPREFRSYNEGE